MLQNLDLSQNQLTGDISVLAVMPFLARARVSENCLTGSLPLHMASSFLQVKICLNPSKRASTTSVAAVRVGSVDRSPAEPVNAVSPCTLRLHVHTLVHAGFYV